MPPTSRADRMTEASPDAAAPCACRVRPPLRSRYSRQSPAPANEPARSRPARSTCGETTPSRIVRPAGGECRDIVSAPTNARANPSAPAPCPRRSRRWHPQLKIAQTNSRSGTNEPSRPPAERPQAPAPHQPRPAPPTRARPNPRAHADPAPQPTEPRKTNPTTPPGRRRTSTATIPGAQLTTAVANCRMNPSPTHPPTAGLGLPAWHPLRMACLQGVRGRSVLYYRIDGTNLYSQRLKRADSVSARL